MTTRATSARVARAAALRSLVGELGDWSAGAGPLHRQLARALAAAVERGAPAPGDRLPSERALAAALAVSRGTAVAAYDALVAEGRIERRPGSGTFVASAGSLGLPPGREGSALVARLVDRSAGPAPLIDLSISVLRDTDGLADVGLSTAELAGVEPDTGYSPWGLPGLRRQLAGLVAGWGLPTEPDEVVVTTGAQQAISALIACWVRPGDTVVAESPTYPGAVAAVGAAGARLVGVPVDAHGVLVEALAEAVAAHRPALVYLQPTLHSPTGALLPEARRRAVAALVARSRVPLVEDHALAGLAWRPSPPPIAASAPDATIAVVGSLSKRWWGGIRLGFVRAPAPVARRTARVKATQDLGSSAVGQVLAERLLRAPDEQANVAARNAGLRRRYEALASSLRAELPGWTWPEPAGGLSLWVRLPRPVAEPLARAALHRGVAVATGAPLTPGLPDPARIRLSFAGPEPELEEGVRRLGRAWADVGG